MYAAHTAAGLQALLPPIVRFHDVPEYLARVSAAYAPALSFPQQTTVQQAINALREMRAVDVGHIYYIFVTDYNERLVGVINLHDLFFAVPGAHLFEVMDRRVFTLSADAGLEEQAHAMSESGLLALPVVDEQGRLVGAMEMRDLIAALEHNSAATAYRLAGLNSGAAIDAPLISQAGYRMIWQSASFVVALLLAWIVGSFEYSVTGTMLVVAMLPLLLRQGSLTGRQSLTMMVRSLALGVVRSGQPATVWRMLRRELLLGGVAGLCLGALAGSVVALWQGSTVLGLIAGGVLFVCMLLAAAAGVLMPLVCTRLRCDPARVSVPAVAAVTDIFSILLLIGLIVLAGQMGYL
ncbi:MAG: magnesium transporter [Chloroflexaceae bacterium]|nr:magnesium transporter [Chloroflexaceae bacterium]NJL33728.1 magnesium transporter [Chloroflexaceae bacterium]